MTLIPFPSPSPGTLCKENLFCGGTSSTACTTGGTACPHQDGVTRNDAPCSCGGINSSNRVACNRYVGMYCRASQNSAFSSKTPVPVCAITDGSAANEEMCQCSPGTVCSPTTGLICYTLLNGEGTCRKSHPGPFAYIKTTTEQQCSDVDTATEIIQNQDECEVAAVLAGETAKSCSSRGRFTASCVKLTGRGAGQDRIYSISYFTPGCTWDSKAGVGFNTYYNSKTHCKSNGCLCKASASCVHQVCLLLWY